MIPITEQVKLNCMYLYTSQHAELCIVWVLGTAYMNVCVCIHVHTLISYWIDAVPLFKVNVLSLESDLEPFIALLVLPQILQSRRQFQQLCVRDSVIQNVWMHAHVCVCVCMYLITLPTWSESLAASLSAASAGVLSCEEASAISTLYRSCRFRATRVGLSRDTLTTGPSLGTGLWRNRHIDTRLFHNILVCSIICWGCCC